jgi:tetratricopeptide (TPR) repeat protein
VALHNLLGCAACLNQDFERGVAQFTAAIKLNGSDVRLHQNLALAYEMQGQMSQAEPHWNRAFDLMDLNHTRQAVLAEQADYQEDLLFEGLQRLAASFAEKEKWATALSYIQRAHKIRPRDTDVMERVFHLSNHAKKKDEARRMLRKLREVKPNEPQYELFEIDLIEVKSLSDIDKMLTEIERIRKRYPGEPRVEERAVSMVGNVIPLMGNLCDQLTEQMGKILDQIRNLPNYQINWNAVNDAMRDLLREFRKLKRITDKCLPLVTSEEHRRIVRDLASHIDRKIEVCRSMGG